MEKYIRGFRNVLRDPEILKKIYAVSLISALLILVLVLKGPEERGRFITDKDGNVTGIERHSLETSEHYDLDLIIDEDGTGIEKEVSITVKAAGRAGSAADTEPTDREAVIGAEIDRLITEIELSDEKKIALPESLSDGTPLIWHAADRDDDTALIFIPVMYAVLVILIIRSGITAPANEEAEIRRKIMRGLPRFCNQLFLMMNAGMILSDAFEKICSSYKEYGEESMSWFERELTILSEQNMDHRISTATMINDFAVRHNVKEMIRIATILNENERRGSDVIDSLSRESRYLWDDRKIVAREEARMIDTKMSWPLGLLLILLIVITMAPALLSI